jgi:subtilase family serine protease
VGGSCAGYGKPFYQTSFPGVPSDGVRGMPDVSLFASSGVWTHYYVYCFSDPANGGVPCTGAPNTWAGAGGTSFASPIWAGIQALLNQKINSLSGNPNYVLYDLARNDTNYTSGHCDGNSPSGPNAGCIFYDVTPSGLSGLNTDMDLPCAPLSGVLHNCFLPAGDNVGVLSTSNTTLQPAYTTQTGWDFASGIGTVNVQNLVNKWPPPPSPGCKIMNGVEICW